jgi:DNA-binding CsgD family transcriptional regulator/GAF domain-containing protein
VGNGIPRNTSQHRRSGNGGEDPPLLELVSDIYRTPLEPEIWPRLLERLVALTGAKMGVQAVVDLAHRQVVYLWDHNAPPGLVVKQHHVDNPWSRASFRHPHGATLLTDELVPRDELQKTEFFHEVLDPLEIGHGIGSNLLHEEGKTALFALFRPAARGPFPDEARRLVEQLVPHIQRATQLHLRLRRTELHLAATERVMERLSIGVLLVDDGGRVSFTNPSARRILGDDDGLLLVKGEIRAVEPHETQLLARLVSQAIRAEAGQGGAMALTRPSGRQPLQLLVAPLSGRHEALPGPRRAVAAIFVSDPEVEPEGCVTILERLYDLTPSEARVAVGVVGGRGLQDVADSIGVGLNTVRTHLQHVFQKTGTRRQAELVQLLLRGPLQLRLEGGPLPPAQS